MSIPEERAVRISSERVSLLDANGNLCLGYSSIPRTLKDGLEKNLVELKTTVIYKTNPEKVHITILYGVNNTISLKDIKEKNFTVTILTRYNVTVLRDTDCTQVEKQINGTMIEMYETNPYFIRDLIFLIIFSVVLLVAGPVCAFLNRNRLLPVILYSEHFATNLRHTSRVCNFILTWLKTKNGSFHRSFTRWRHFTRLTTLLDVAHSIYIKACVNYSQLSV